MLSPSQRRKLEKLVKQHTDISTISDDKNICAGTEQRVKNLLFPQQLEVLDDPSQWKAILASRRAGKTYMLASALTIEALRTSGVKSLYLATTRISAKEIIWDTLLDINENLSLGGKPNAAELTITYPNGSQVIVSGCETSRDMGSHRGKKYAIICIDECGFWGEHLREFIDDVLVKTTYDLGNCPVLLVGTPNATCTGYFHEVTNTDKHPKFKKWTWLLSDNAKLPQWSGKKNWRELAAAFIEKERQRHIQEGIEKTFLREDLCQWVRDDEVLVFDFDEERNTFDTLPVGDYKYVLGIDVGFNDEFVVIAGCWNSWDGNLYITDCFEKSETLTAEKVQVIERFVNTFYPIATGTDPGGGGLQLVHDFEAETGLSLDTAIKPRNQKGPDLQRISDQMSVGKIKVKFSLFNAIEQIKLLQWKDKSKWELDKRFKRNITDAILYAFRLSDHHIPRGEMPTPPPTIEQSIKREVLNETRRQEEIEDVLYGRF